MKDYYSFVEMNKNDYQWYRFKNNYISNEERLEGSELSKEEIHEIITDIRFFGKLEIYGNNLNSAHFETAGQVEMFDYIYNIMAQIPNDPIQKLHRMLYSYSLYPEYSGQMRITNPVISAGSAEIIDVKFLDKHMKELTEDIYELDSMMLKLKNSQLIIKVAEIHHRLTVIHPFDNGNGRVSRGLTNMFLVSKGIYPIYVNISRKDKYFKALKKADIDDDLDLLIEFLIDEIIESDIVINDSGFDRVQ